MSSPELSARLRYLNESAHLLATTAPETSRHLKSKCNALIFDHQIEDIVVQKKDACGACGTLIVLGQEGALEGLRTKSRKKGKGKVPVQSGRERTTIYECRACGVKTRETVKVPPLGKRLNKVSSMQKSIEKPGEVVKPMVTSFLTSKKRAKNRKGGLAAILAQKKANDGPTTGFDLMDFMKMS